MSQNKTNQYKITTLTGLAIVLANMIGTGAFTSLGFQVKSLHQTSTILTLWMLGGVIALSGAFSYAEVGSSIKKSGGEYAFLSQLYNPLIGYLSGWISLTVGFTAPIALSAMALISYFPYLSVNPRWAAIVVIGIITFIHTRNLKTSAIFQNSSTVIKMLLILFLIVIGAFLPGITSGTNATEASYLTELISPAFAIALIYVVYSYSGWNAAAYITNEFENPSKSLPIVLIGGTIIVTILYTLLQYIFLKHLTLGEMEGQLNVAALAAQKMFGKTVGNLFGLALSISLISSVSAMVWVGARITASMANDHSFLSLFKMQSNHLPVRALWLQFGISSLLILTGTFEQILVYCGILISLSSMLVVIGIYKIRKQPDHKEDTAYKSPWYPFFQIIFVLLTLWMIIFTLYDKPWESLAGMINLLIGMATFYWGHFKLKYFQK